MANVTEFALRIGDASFIKSPPKYPSDLGMTGEAACPQSQAEVKTPVSDKVIYTTKRKQIFNSCGTSNILCLLPVIGLDTQGIPFYKKFQSCKYKPCNLIPVLVPCHNTEKN